MKASDLTVHKEKLIGLKSAVHFMQVLEHNGITMTGRGDKRVVGVKIRTSARP